VDVSIHHSLHNVNALQPHAVGVQTNVQLLCVFVEGLGMDTQLQVFPKYVVIDRILHVFIQLIAGFY